MKYKKVAIVTPYKKYFGGVESVNANLATVLDEWDVEVVAVEKCQPAGLWQRAKVGLCGKVALAESALKEQFDVVICNGEFGWGIDHPRAINLFHGSAYGYRKGVNPYISWRERGALMRESWIQRCSAKNKRVVAVSSQLAKVLDEQGIAVDSVIENGVDCRRFYPGRENRKGLLFVGSSDYYGKGIDRLEELAKKGREITTVSQKRVSPFCRWVAARSNEEMAELYRKHTILLLPSRFEGMSMTMLEAMASGMPVLTTAVGIGPQLKEIIPEFVVDGENWEEKIEVIEADFEKYSEVAHRFVKEKYTLDHFGKKWRALLSAL